MTMSHSKEGSTDTPSVASQNLADGQWQRSGGGMSLSHEKSKNI
jgi:hypothetical protein